jgi:hypothetical protein
MGMKVDPRTNTLWANSLSNTEAHFGDRLRNPQFQLQRIGGRLSLRPPLPWA